MTGAPLPAELAFNFDLLASAGAEPRPLSICADGHLVVAGRSHYVPVRFTADRRSVVCAWVDHVEG